MNRSYMIGYRFQRRVKKYMEGKGWNVICRPKSAFPDLHCWKKKIDKTKDLEGIVLPIYYVIEVECKVNKYLSKAEKEKATELLGSGSCARFYVASRKNRKLIMEELR